MHVLHWLQVGGLIEAFFEVVVVAGALVMLFMLVALGGFVYKSLRGGIEWPDEQPDEDRDGVSRGEDDDEWEFY